MSQQAGAGKVFGRDWLIERIWKTLDLNSLRFTAERRIQKVNVTKNMDAEPREGWQVIFSDLKSVASPEGFVEALLSKIKPLMPARQAGQQGFQKILKTISGTEIGGVIKLPEFGKIGWLPTIDKAFEGIWYAQEIQKQKGSVSLLIDPG